jgi:PAS domain S-box-containing protein
VSTAPDILQDTFPGDSVMSAAMRAHDWASTPLGEPAGWPEGLKVPLRMMLTSRFEMWLGWGDDIAFFYNDAYIPTLGEKHGLALGRPVREVWTEIFDTVKDRFFSVMRDGASTWDKALLLLLERNGYPEETYHTFSYSPLRGDTGRVEGLMCVVTEETERVISERRLETLRGLATALLGVRVRADVEAGVRAALSANDRDFPFSYIRLFGEAELTDEAEPTLPTATATATATATEPDATGLEGIEWAFEQIKAGKPSVTTPLKDSAGRTPKGAWDIPAQHALVAAITKPGRRTPSGALVLGLNPYRPDDPEIEAFAGLIANQIAGALATVDARRSEAAETERLRQLFEQSPSFITVLRGPEHRFELVNPGYMQLIAHRDVLGKPVREAIPEVEGQGFFELLDRVYATGEPFIGTGMPIVIQRTPGGEPEDRILDFVYQPIREGHGAVSGIFVEGIDVTAGHEATAALRESEGRFRTLAEAMPNQVWTSAPDGQLDWFNSSVYKYSGAAPGTLDGEGWTAMVHPDDMAGAGRSWASSIGSGEIYETQFRLRRSDGAYRWHIARAVPLRNDEGETTQWVGTNTDTHDQILATEALAGLNATLEHQVAERTSELMAAEEALRQAQKMEAVGQLTGGIAHDFNNLLAGIVGSLELLESRINQGRLQAVPRYLNAAHGAARRAAALTQRLLAFSRRQTLDPKALSLNRLIADMEDLIRRTSGPNVEIEVVGAGGLWLTLVDQNQLENALLNLCINARDAMPDGGRITIETANRWLDDKMARERDLTPGQYVSLCVTDTGTGMTPEVIARAFDPFFTTKPMGEGTGLGLSMIYGFVRQSGGQVRIYSEVGQGTTMCLYLPRHVGEADEPQAKVAAGAHDYTGHGETVLVVDDDSTVRMLITDLLDEAGYLSVEAGDGATGLKILQTDARVDLLITDVGLPGGLNGRQVADAARVLRPNLKVLFITGYAENAVMGSGRLEAGMQIITKPFSIEAMGEKIREMIDS